LSADAVAPPTIYVTNWSSKLLHGPGRRFTIMAKPRHWEQGAGYVLALTPSDPPLLRALMERALQERRSGEGHAAFDCYRDAFKKALRGCAWHGLLVPGGLAWAPHGVWGMQHPVKDGDSLLCACSRAEAAAGRCHRVWVAEALKVAGWRVILDGQELQNTLKPTA